MTRRTRGRSVPTLLLGLLLASALPAGVAEAATTSAAAPQLRCEIDAYGHTRDGRIHLRKIAGNRVTVAKATARPVSWGPVAWGLVMLNSWPGHEETHQVVAATDGKVRLVRTEWNTRGSLRTTVLKVLGSGYPSRLIAFNDRSLYWVATDGLLHRATWNGRRLVRPRALPVPIRQATTLTAATTERGGSRVYYTDRAGALHLVRDEGAQSTDTVLRTSGYAAVTALRSGTCIDDRYTGAPVPGVLLVVDRTTGVARVQRVLRPDDAGGGTLAAPVRVRPGGWTWRRLG
ncbi:hypothetical protein ACFJIY_25705 [Pimelobacter simplex]|uniref:hypothetical protein n=1 Tax=Nocardioides simplex TaxID=2045 RepID=UPI0036704896